MARKSTGKRLRFEIMKRDGFKCRYCGATAATVLLHIDHVVPVAEGGSSDPANLVTACVDCNGGKSRIPLDESQLPEQEPTSDMLEHAEQMRAYLDAVKERESAFGEMADYAESLWKERVSHYVNGDTSTSLRRAVSAVGLDRVIEAIGAVAKSNASSSYDRVRYFNGVIRNMRNRDEEVRVARLAARAP